MRPETASHTRTGAAGNSRRTRPEPTFCSGLADLAARYRGFIVDQWGVLHDGGAPYPLALEALAELRAAGKRVVLLSNSGKRAAINRRRLAALGIAPDLYDGLVTSGEATWQALAERGDPVFARLGRRCLLWSRDGDRSLVEDQKLELADDVANADFLLLGGIAGRCPAGAVHGRPRAGGGPRPADGLRQSRRDRGAAGRPLRIRAGGARAAVRDFLAAGSPMSANRSRRFTSSASTPSARWRETRSWWSAIWSRTTWPAAPAWALRPR